MDLLNENQINRFYEKLIPDGDCLVFTGCVDRKGYGIIGFTINGKCRSFKAHRLALFLVDKKLPENYMFALHRPLICHNPRCCKPDHLYWGSVSDNTRDSKIDGTFSMPPIGIGEKNGQSKLNENKVMDILSLLKDKKLTLKEIGVRFGVSDQCIYRISSGKAWRHVTA